MAEPTGVFIEIEIDENGYIYDDNSIFHFEHLIQQELERQYNTASNKVKKN